MNKIAINCDSFVNSLFISSIDLIKTVFLFIDAVSSVQRDFLISFERWTKLKWIWGRKHIDRVNFDFTEEKWSVSKWNF